MTYAKHSLPAMTAIAAVLAFANPAMAQEVTPTPVTAAPVAAEPVATTPPVSDTTTTPSDPLSPVAAMPVEPAAAEPIEPRASRSTARSARTANRSVSTPRRVTAPAPSARAATPANLPAATLESANVAATASIAAPLAAVAPVASPVVEPAPAPPAQTEFLTDNGLEIAGAAGLGILALLGFGAALRRRSRRNEEADFEAFDQPLEPAMAPAAQPMREPIIRRDRPAVAATTAGGEPVAAPVTSLPDGFDLSRFGAHVQAAYRGPTEDNPSLSLKHRLRRASAMDQMARRDGADPAPAPEAKAQLDSGAVVSRMSPAPRSSDSFMLGNGAVRPGLRPVTQH